MKAQVFQPAPDTITDELLALLLEEAERALLVVEGRADEPGLRTLEGDATDRELVDEDSSELRLAIAELVDAHPSITFDLESIGERLRNVGARAATQELESCPHVLDLVRMSLEVFIRSYPHADAYEADRRRTGEVEGDGITAAETYETYRQLLELLKTRVS